MEVPIVAIIVTIFLFLITTGTTIILAITGKVQKKEDEKQSKGDLLVMETIKGVKAEILGEIKLLTAGQKTIEKQLEKTEKELEVRTTESRAKADSIKEMTLVLEDIKSRLIKMENLAQEVHDLKKDVEEIKRGYVNIIK